MRKRSNHTIRPETEEEKSLPHMMDNLALDAIRVDPELQIRVKENPAKIQEYGEKMSRGVEFTPCVVFVDGDAVYWMSDGIQRFKGAQLFNVKTLLCEIRVGTRRDALRYALSANENHGDQRTNADRRNAIKIASRDPEWSKLTPNAIAELCDVSPHLVLEVLEELGVEAGIIGADGKRYPKKAKQTKEDKNIQSVQKGRKPQRYKQLEPTSESNCVTSEISDVVDFEHKRNQGRNAKFIKAEDELVALTKAKGKFHVLFLNLTGQGRIEVRRPAFCTTFIIRRSLSLELCSMCWPIPRHCLPCGISFYSGALPTSPLSRLGANRESRARARCCRGF
jgi:ParB-like chromosome segregation protein Spo0J